MKDQLLETGLVAALHGTAGKVRITPASGDPSGMLRVRTLRLCGKGSRNGSEGRDFRVRTAQRSGGCAVFSFEGIETAEAAGELVGMRVFVRRAELPPPGEGEYFVADLVGCDVVSAEGIPIGMVSGVVSGPAHDWLEIRCAGGGEALLPAVSRFIIGVDIDGRRIVASPPEGWLDAR